VEPAQRDLAARYGPWALIAGGSDGIGEAFARRLAAAGINLVLVARRSDVLAAAASALEAEHGVEVRTLALDLTAEGLEAAVAAVVADLEVGLLVYNAGAVHGAATFLDRSPAEARHLVDLNCTGPVVLAHLLGRPMRERHRGGMIFMTSMSALSGAAYVATYAATKSFDLVLAEGLWHELRPEGVDVLAVVAGATDTPAMRASIEGFGQTMALAEPDDVAAAALAALGRGPVCVPDAANAEAAAYLRANDRVEIINMMSQATAAMYDLPFTPATAADPAP